MRRFQDVLLLVGQLNYTWTNTESLLIHMIAGLAQSDKETAIVIFLTLNTPRARIDLVERLAKMQKTPADCRADILDATRRLSEEAKLRNKYNHCIYSFDPALHPYLYDEFAADPVVHAEDLVRVDNPLKIDGHLPELPQQGAGREDFAT